LKFATTHTSLTGTDIEQGGAWRDKAAECEPAIADNAVDRRVHHRVVEINLREVACGLCLRHRSDGGFALAGEDGDALLWASILPPLRRRPPRPSTAPRRFRRPGPG